MQRVEDSTLWRLLDNSIWSAIGLIVALFVLAWLVRRIRMWFRDDTDPTADDHLLLTQISELRREGDLSEDEYRSIKGRLVAKLSQTTEESDGSDETSASPTDPS